MTPTRPACALLLLAALATVAPGLDVEMMPTTIPGFFFHPEVGVMYVPLPKNLQKPHVAGYSAVCTMTVWFNGAGAVDTVWGEGAHQPGTYSMQRAISLDWRDDLRTARVAWTGLRWPEHGLRAEVILSAMHYDSLGNARPEEPVEDGPHRRTLAPWGRLSRPSSYSPSMVIEVIRARAYTATQPTFPARVVRPEFGLGIDMVQGVEPSLYYVPNVCVVRMPTITVSQEQAAAAGFVGEKRMGVRVRFGPTGGADRVELYWPSGSAIVDSLLARTARKATLRKSPGVSFATRPTVVMHYRATVLRLRGGQNPDIFRGWLEPDTLQLVTTE